MELDEDLRLFFFPELAGSFFIGLRFCPNKSGVCKKLIKSETKINNLIGLDINYRTEAIIRNVSGFFLVNRREEENFFLSRLPFSGKILKQ